MTLEQAIGVGTLLIAVFLAYIAYRQYLFGVRSVRLEEARYISELFDRRFEIFRAAQELLSCIVATTTCTLEDVQCYTNKAQQSYFLFDDDIYHYLMTIRTNAIQLAVMGKARDLSTEPTQRVNFSNKHMAALDYLVHEISDNRLFEKFKSYLRPIYL